MGQRDRITSKAQLELVRQILWVEWDPIGVNDTPEAYGEYDSYAESVLRNILHGATAADLDFYLSRIESQSMGLGPRPASSRSRAVSKLLAVASGAASSNHEGPDVFAMVTLLPAEAGGRTAKTYSGYRPHHACWVTTRHRAFTSTSGATL